MEKGGKFKAEEDFTPARRYSFLVGSHESSHTAQRQLLPILADDKHNPTLSLIENAFSIETVTKEFFEKYRDLFVRVKEALDALVDSDKVLRKEFRAKDVNTADFAKKLLGQIVFLYFLQKKGWFGVARDAAWGSGHKNFLRQLFEGKLMRYKNFFDDVLEPLFYEALAVEREENYYSKFNCKIPFLNGGLFDPLNGYDWVHTDITFSNDLFSNTVKTKEGDIGSGILDIFDRYNFTVKEDEPLEKEVAVDPEMLGKVFENLLEVDERSAKGTYYTPREIVHYMCEESLINYLATELEGKVLKEDITKLVYSGNMMIEHESRVANEGKETRDYSFKLPESIRKHAVLIDQKLEDIRVCDPAIGSGAFPVGMMSEIVSARETLSSYLPATGNRTPYDFKRHAIQECLYGVDLDPGAVEIAKLRLWLSLIVDEDDIARIKPLPNLDYRIMQGNSLLEEFEGIRLFDEKLLESNTEDKEKELANAKDKISTLQQEYFALHSSGKLKDVRKDEIQLEIKRLQALQKQLQAKPKPTEKVGMFDSPSRVGDVLNKLKTLHKAFFEATQRKKKDEIKKQIEELEWELIEISLTEKKKNDLLAKLKRTRVRPFFLWKLHFADVFREKGGFDIVIANPPYLRVQGIDKSQVQTYKKLYRSATGRFDLYVLFVECAISLTRKNGTINFIMPDKWKNSAFGSGLRSIISASNYLYKLISFEEYQVFNASTYSSLAWFRKSDNKSFLFSKLQRDLKTNRELDEYLNELNEGKFSEIQADTLDSTKSWTLTSSETGTVILKMRKQPLTTKDIFEGIYQGIITIGDDIFYIPGKIEGDHFIGKSDRLGEEVIFEKEIMKPLLMGDDIKRYAPLVNSMFCLYPHYVADSKTKPYEEAVLREKFPMAFKYLMKFKEELQSKKVKYKTNPTHWYSLHRAREMEVFEQEKIITPYLSLTGDMTLDTNSHYTNAKCYNLVKKTTMEGSYRFYLGLLNSKLTSYYIRCSGTVFRGGYLAYTSDYLDSLPLPDSSLTKEQHDIESYVDRALEAKKGNPKADTKQIEAEIDKLVYQIYGLTEEEIRTLEKSIAR
ncbi:MAG: TaqI-like C-terminal specificity domain-containing protein [Candidatus Peregrinibacteria bacterium]